MNGASFAAGGALAPGSIASIFGDNLADTSDPATVNGIQATSLPLPTTLGGAKVQVASTLAQLFYVSRKQINFLVPMEVGDAAQTRVVVLVGSMPSNQPTVSLKPAVPGIFEANLTTHQGAILLANTAFLAQPAGAYPGSKPVGAGQAVSIFCTGLGAVQDATKPDSQTKVIPKILIGTDGKLQAIVLWSGIAPGFVGLNQVNVEIPATAPIGSAIPITLTVGEDPNTIRSNTVTIAIEAGISILLDRTEIKVTAPAGGGNPSAAAVSVRNDGLPSTVLNPTISVSGTGCTWLTTSPSSLSGLVGGRGAPSPPAPGIFNVNFNVSGVDSGTYTCRINVTDPNAGNSPQTIDVTLTVPAPEMSVDPPSLPPMTGTTTGGDPDAKTLTITNTGAGYLSGTVAASLQTPAGGSWLSVSPASYSRLSGSTAAKITVSARAVGLVTGTYTGSVTIKGNGVPDKTIPVNLLVGTSVPCTDLITSLAFSPPAVGGNPPSRAVKVWNCGAGILKVNVTATTTSGGNWLAVTPASFSGLTGGSTGTTGTLTVSVNVSGMGPGRYNGAITVTDADSPAKVIVSVTLTIMDPVLGVSTNILTFDAPASGGNPANQTVSVFNLGGGILNATAAVTSGAWLGVSPASLSGLSGATTGTLTVSASVAGLAADSYGGTITITAPGAINTPQTITVTLNNRPVIKLSPTSISFNAQAGGANPFSYTVTISNAGPGTMSGTVSAGTTTGGNWLSVSPSSFSNLAGSATATLTVSVNTLGLSAATYRGTITITAPGAGNTPQTISVTLTLTPP